MLSFSSLVFCIISNFLDNHLVFDFNFWNSRFFWKSDDIFILLFNGLETLPLEYLHLEIDFTACYLYFILFLFLISCFQFFICFCFCLCVVGVSSLNYPIFYCGPNQYLNFKYEMRY